MNRINISSNDSFLRGVVVPEETVFYKPILHGNLIDLVREGLAKNNLALVREEYRAAKGGLQATGHYFIQKGDDPEMGLQFVWQNSYDKEVSLKLAVGASVFVCSNGMVVGDLGAFRHKHTGVIQTLTPTTINEFINKADDTFKVLVEQRERMKEYEASKQLCAELAGRLFIEEGIINSEQISIIKNQMRKPSFDYGAKGSLWEFYNHVTYALKEDHPQHWMTDHARAHKLITQQFDLV